MKKAKKKVELLEIYDVEGYQNLSDGGSSSKDKKGGSGSKNGGNAGKVTGSTNKKDSNTGNRGAGGNVTTSSKNSSNNNNNNTLKSSNSNSKNQSNNATLKTATKTAINIAGNFLEGAVGLGSKLLSTTMGETKGNKTVKKVVTTTPTKKVATSPTPKVYNGNDYKSKIVTNTSTNVLDSKLSDPLKGTLKTEMDLKTIVQDSMDIRKVAKKAAQDTGNTKKGTVLDGGGVYKKSVTVGEFKQAEEKQDKKNATVKNTTTPQNAIYTTASGQKVTTQDAGYSDDAKKVINDANRAIKEEIKGVKKALVAETKSLVKEGKELLKDPVGTIVNYGKDKAKEELKKLASGKIELNGVISKIDVDLKEQKLNFDIGVPYVAAIKGSLDRNGYAGASTEKVEEKNGVVDKGVKREVDLKNGTYKRTSETSTIEVDAKNKSMGYKGVNGTTMSYVNEGKELSLGTSQSSITVSGENKSFSYTGKDENFSLDTKGNMSVENSNGTKVEVDLKNKVFKGEIKNVGDSGNLNIEVSNNKDFKVYNEKNSWEYSVEKSYVNASVTIYESDTAKVEATGGFSIKNGLNAGARGNVEGEKAAYTGDVKVHVSTGTLAVVGVAVAVESGVVGALSEGGAIAAEAIAGVATYGKSALNTISNYIPEGLKFSY